MNNKEYKIYQVSYNIGQHDVVRENTHILKSAIKIYFLGILIYSTLDFR